MLKQARVEDISKNRITKSHDHIVVVTHYYPRFLKRKLIDKYIKELAPTRELLLLIAKEKFEAPVARVYHQYPIFQPRIQSQIQRPD